MQNLMKLFVISVKNKINKNTCLKNPNNNSCIDLKITTRPKSLETSMVINTVLSDFHKLYITVMKICYSKQKFYIIHNSKFKDFNNDFLYKMWRPSKQHYLMKKQSLFRYQKNKRSEPLRIRQLPNMLGLMKHLIWTKKQVRRFWKDLAIRISF